MICDRYINFRDNYLPKIRETAKGVQELAKRKMKKIKKE
jgi:hypothetical protein